MRIECVNTFDAMHTKRRVIGLAILVLFLMSVGCSNTATVKMADGRIYEATILRSDAENLYVRGDLDHRAFSNSPEKITKLKKADIVVIDHPGNVHLLVGSLLAGFGTLYGVLGVVLFVDSPNDPVNQLIAGQLILNSAVLLGVGVPMGLWGWSTWDDSKTMSQSTDGFLPESQPRILLLPTVDTQEAKFGLSLHLSF